MAARAVGRVEVRRLLAEHHGDLRAVGERLGLDTQQILMILAYDITVTSADTKERGTATDVFDAITADDD